MEWQGLKTIQGYWERMKLQTKKAFDSHGLKARLPVDFCGDFKRDFGATSNRPCKLLAIQIAAESLVVYMGDFKIAAKSRLKSPLKSQQNSPV